MDIKKLNNYLNFWKPINQFPKFKDLNYGDLFFILTKNHYIESLVITSITTFDDKSKKISFSLRDICGNESTEFFSVGKYNFLKNLKSELLSKNCDTDTTDILFCTGEMFLSLIPKV